MYFISIFRKDLKNGEKMRVHTLLFITTKSKNKRGATLIELVIAMSILFVLFPTAMLVFSQIMQTRFLNEHRIVCINFAQQITEHLSQRRYTSIDDFPLTDIKDPDVNGSNPFYDTDADFENYQFDVVVDCVESNGTNNIDSWPRTDFEGTANCDASDGDNFGYKRIVVNVYYDQDYDGSDSGTANPWTTITVTSLVSDTRDS